MTDEGTSCFSSATPGLSNLSQTIYNGSIYDKVFYAYAQCPNNQSIQKYLCPQKRLYACVCDTRKNIIDALAYSQLVVAGIGIILNLVVLILYAQRKTIQNNIGNVQLAGQAFVDLLNLVLYAIPLGFGTLVTPAIFCQISPKVLWITIVALFSFTFYSSLITFTFISFERYMALYKPFWHRQNITKRWIIKRLIIVFCSVFFIITPIQTVTYVGTPFIYAWMWIWMIWIIIVSVLFGLTFIKTYKCLNDQREGLSRKCKESNEDTKDETNDQDYHVHIKILRLTLILFIMFAVFLMTILPVLVVVALVTLNRRPYRIQSAISNLMFFLASVINPILTLSLKEDFRVWFNVCKRDSTRQTIKLKETRKKAPDVSLTSSISTLSKSEQS